VIRLRAPEPGDADGVLAVLVARDVADLGAPDFTLADLRDEWQASDFDLATDAVVAQAPTGELVAYAAVRRPGALAVVAPAHEGLGIGTQLLAWAENRERELGRAIHVQWVAGANAQAAALLSAAGYSVTRSYWRMARSLADHPAEQSRPGFEMRSLDLDRDASTLHALDAASFSANADYRPETLAAFIEEHLQAHDLEPALSIVAEHAGAVAGFLLARRWPESVGYVDILAVHPDLQRRGLGSALLRTAFARFAAAGLREAQLGVASDNPRALHLYERVGMTPRFRADTYERPAR
jgi:mycothiol synthase